MFEVAFSSDDDETIADAMCAWITDTHRTPAGLFARYFSNRTENTTPFPQRFFDCTESSLKSVRGAECF